jgi:hypothetical protein
MPLTIDFQKIGVQTLVWNADQNIYLKNYMSDSIGVIRRVCP